MPVRGALIGAIVRKWLRSFPTARTCSRRVTVSSCSPRPPTRRASSRRSDLGSVAHRANAPGWPPRRRPSRRSSTSSGWSGSIWVSAVLFPGRDWRSGTTSPSGRSSPPARSRAAFGFGLERSDGGRREAGRRAGGLSRRLGHVASDRRLRLASVPLRRWGPSSIGRSTPIWREWPGSRQQARPWSRTTPRFPSPLADVATVHAVDRRHGSHHPRHRRAAAAPGRRTADDGDRAARPGDRAAPRPQSR